MKGLKLDTKTQPNFSELAALALALKNSNVKEVAQLAEGFLELEAAYGELRHQVIRQTSELVMRRHETLFKKLADAEKKEKDEQSDSDKS